MSDWRRTAVPEAEILPAAISNLNGTVSLEAWPAT